MTGTPPKPLDGILVLDLSQFLAGPACTLRLADLGARVIKIERPCVGDSMRQIYLADAAIEGDSLLYHSINRDKQSVAADLKDPSDRALLEPLIAEADVLIQNFRPGVIERLGLGYDAVSKINPRLVYGSISGFGPMTDWRHRPGQDLLAQAQSGLLFMSGEDDDPPTPFGISIADILAGNHLCQGILACLVRRGVTGQGGLVEASLMESMLDLQFEEITTFLNTDRKQPARSAAHHGHVYHGAPYGVYETKDGYVAVAMNPIDRLNSVIGDKRLDEYAPRETWFRNRDTIKRIIQENLRSQTTREWLQASEEVGLWSAEVFDWAKLWADPAFASLQMVQLVASHANKKIATTRCPIRIDGEILLSGGGAAELGADNEAVMQEFLTMGSDHD